jgi:hypothetical protein
LRSSCSPSSSPLRLRDPGLVRLEGIFTAVEASTATTYGPWRAGTWRTYSPSRLIRATSKLNSPGGMIFCCSAHSAWTIVWRTAAGGRDAFQASRPMSASYGFDLSGRRAKEKHRNRRPHSNRQQASERRTKAGSPIQCGFRDSPPCFAVSYRGPDRLWAARDRVAIPQNAWVNSGESRSPVGLDRGLVPGGARRKDAFRASRPSSA